MRCNQLQNSSMHAAGLTLAQIVVLHSKTPARTVLESCNSSGRAARHSINRQHLEADFDLERKISKTTGPMRIACLHDESVADSQNLQNLTGVGIFVRLWPVAAGCLSWTRSISPCRLGRTIRLTRFRGPHVVNTVQYLQLRHWTQTISHRIAHTNIKFSRQNQAAAHFNDGIDRGERAAVDTGPHDVSQSVHLALVHPVALQQASEINRSRGGAAAACTRTCRASNIRVVGIDCG